MLDLGQSTHPATYHLEYRAKTLSNSFYSQQDQFDSTHESSLKSVNVIIR